ncbi:MAG TPA: methyltransferase [Candidatus Methylomirabilis sp.]|nr:methyltransferase [Candidatus Methylomirabilis sp.]
MNPSEGSVDNALSPQGILEAASAFMRSRVLLTAHDLGVFTAVGEEHRSSVDVAQALHTDGRATDRLMNALCAMGLLEKANGLFSNTPLGSRFLVEGGPEFLAGLTHTLHLWETWSTLTDAVRRGGPVTSCHVNERGAEWLHAFIAAMHWRARQHAPGVIAALDLSGVSRVLDVGGGSGAYATAFVRASKGMSAVVLDLPNVVPLTRDYIEREGLSNRVEIAVGDYERDELGTGFDLVFVSAIIHSNSPDLNRALTRKSVKALNPSGQLVVQDFIVSEDRTGPPFSALFALNMLVGTTSGDTYTESEVRGWMEEAGLSRIVRKDTNFGTSLIVGRKT